MDSVQTIRKKDGFLRLIVFRVVKIMSTDKEIDGQKDNLTMVFDALPGPAAPKMNKFFVHMAHVSSNRACAQDGYLK